LLEALLSGALLLPTLAQLECAFFLFGSATLFFLFLNPAKSEQFTRDSYRINDFVE